MCLKIPINDKSVFYRKVLEVNVSNETFDFKSS